MERNLKQLAEERQNWERLTKGVARVLRSFDIRPVRRAERKRVHFHFSGPIEVALLTTVRKHSATAPVAPRSRACGTLV